MPDLSARPRACRRWYPNLSIDEMTGIQALERIAPTLPVRLGRVERREFEYTRHGTCILIASFNVATGAASADIGETRTEEDFAAHLAALVQQPRMHLAMDNLNTHYSESAVRLVAEHIGSEGDLGRKGRCGILRNAASRQTFLSDPEHPLGFHFTPKHASWLNQIEIWFSTPAHPSRQLPIQERPGRQDRRFHQLLQRNHGQTIPLDISRYAPHRLATSSITIFAQQY